MAESSRMDELRRRVQQDPASIAFAALAEEYRRARRFRDAVDTSRAGLRHHPNYLSARVTLGRSLIEMGEYEPAERELVVVLRSAPDNLAARRALGELCWQQLRFADALHHYRTALALVPRDTELPGIVDALEKEIEAEEAARALEERAVEIPPADEAAIHAEDAALDAEVAALDAEGATLDADVPADGTADEAADRPEDRPEDRSGHALGAEAGESIEGVAAAAAVAAESHLTELSVGEPALAGPITSDAAPSEEGALSESVEFAAADTFMEQGEWQAADPESPTEPPLGSEGSLAPSDPGSLLEAVAIDGPAVVETAAIVPREEQALPPESLDIARCLLALERLHAGLRLEQRRRVEEDASAPGAARMRPAV